MKVRTRFAPSPTGYLHIGGLRTALYAWLYAKKEGGDFILRIEDTDRNRLVEDACGIIYRTMKETGLTYDEGPDVGGDFGPYIQSERQALYRQYAEELVARGAAYYCFCTKERLDALHASATEAGTVAKYDKHCLSLSPEEVRARIAAGEPYVIRQNIPDEGETTYEDLVYGSITVPMSELEDNVLLKSDGWPTYNLANVIDDHLMQITHVIRGVEYLSSTPKYNLLYDALGWQRPTYIHLPPVMKDKTRKLSKRHGDASYEDFIAKGYLKEAILNYVALLGWSPAGTQEIFTMDELAAAFDLRGISKSPSIFDVDKLTWMNAEYIRALPAEEFLTRATPWLDKALHGAVDYALLSPLIQPRLETLAQIPEKVAFLTEFPSYDLALYTHKKMKTSADTALPVLERAYALLDSLDDYTIEGLHEPLLGLAAEMGLKNGQVLWPVRVAISGVAVTPGGATEIAALLGKQETLRRLRVSMNLLRAAQN